ncbi:hypothetical protein Tco_0955065 [Tanacetum coccineum]|uniref:Zinc finger, CCHC-type n=1 Tax=Tanacetum coccineum TaxID=301880 RepID=A0ABQ5E654_9ASTR
MEAEFLALAAASKEAEWLRNMLLDIELWPQPMPAISLHCDNQSTLSRAYNKVYNEGQRGASDITAGHVGNPKLSHWLDGRGSDPRAQMDGFGIKG